jgi:hypothetical protein
VTIETGLDFNAWAGINNEGQAKYGFRYGIILAAKDVSNYLMCDEKFCPWIPLRDEQIIDSSGGSPMVDLIRYAYPSPDPAEHVFRPARFLESKPAGGTTPRIRFSEMISRGVMKYISYHEQAHYHLGHVHFMNSRHHGKSLGEFDSLRAKIATSPSEAERVNFFLEHQADSIAFQNMFYGCSKLAEKLPDPYYVGYREDLLTYADFLQAHCIGIQIALGIFELYESRIHRRPQNDEQLRFRTHPTSVSRIMHSYRIFLDEIVFQVRAKELALEANNTFLVNEKEIADALGIEAMTIEMVEDMVHDRSVDDCQTAQGAELSGYRNKGHDLMFEMLRYAPKS